MKKTSDYKRSGRMNRDVPVDLFRSLCVLLFLTCIPFLAYGISPQDGVVKGIVKDARGVPMAGVSVRLAGTMAGVATDAEGRFTFRSPVDEGTLLVSFIGYKTGKVPFKGNVTLTILLVEDVAELDAVQVVAYGEQRVREVVGSVASLQAEALKDKAGGDLVGKLQGKLAGVSVVNPSGAPGYSGSITVRGHNSLSIERSRIGSDPLWVVDGVPVYTAVDPGTGQSPLATIPSSEIERIDVLKDAASCAMYGSRAANGVILITTKSGRLNEKFRVTAAVTRSFSFRADLPTITVGNAERRLRLDAYRNYAESVYDYTTNTQHYIGSPEEAVKQGLQKDYFWNMGRGNTVAYLQDSLNPFYNNANAWYRQLFRVRRVTDASVGFSGGSDKMAFYLGIGYYKERGALVKTGFSRASLSGNFTFKPNPKVRGRLGFTFTRTTTDRAGKDTDDYSRGDNLTPPEIPEQFMTVSTLMLREGTPAYDYFINRYKYMREDNEAYRFRTNLSVGYEVADGLRLQANCSFDYLGTHRNTFLPMEVNAYKRSYSGGRVQRTLSALNEDMVYYEKMFRGGHRLKAMAGISFQLDQLNLMSGYAYGHEDKVYYSTWWGSVYDPATKDQLKEYNTNKTKSALVSVFARFGYNYKDKYIAEAVLRRDASSRFGRNTRWATFPSVAVGYAFTEEAFMQSLQPVLSFGKLRFSWGKTGMQFSDPYLSQGIYGSGAFTFQGKPTMTTTQPPNPDLTWEETDQYDLGLDLRFWDGRAGLVADYYYRYTDKMLYLMALGGDYSGFTQQWQNACAVSNQGIELTLDADIIRTDKFRWGISFNIARNWNRLEKSQNNQTLYNPFTSNNVSVVGKELNRLWVLDDRAGFYKKQADVPVYYSGDRALYLGGYNQYYREGDRIIRDVDGDGIINTITRLKDDRVDAGSPLPKAYGGVSMSVDYKGFDFSVSMPFSIGRHVLYGDVLASLSTTPTDLSPVFADLNDFRFYKDGTENANMPRNAMTGQLNNFAQGLYSNVYKVSYIKLGLISLGYTFSREMLRFAALRIFVSGENLFKISKFPGHDPELGDPVSGMYHISAYPQSRTVNFGLTVKF